MFMTSEYELCDWDNGMSWCRYLAEEEYCPQCGNVLLERDRRNRIIRYWNGEKSTIKIRRMYCPLCKRIHTELPDILLPYKQYAADIIEDAIDSVPDAGDFQNPEGPTKISMKLWIAWLRDNESSISALYFYSIQHTQKKYQNIQILYERIPVTFDSLRRRGTGWLSAALSFIYSCGFSL